MSGIKTVHKTVFLGLLKSYTFWSLLYNLVREPLCPFPLCNSPFLFFAVAVDAPWHRSLPSGTSCSPSLLLPGAGGRTGSPPYMSRPGSSSASSAQRAVQKGSASTVRQSTDGVRVFFWHQGSRWRVNKPTGFSLFEITANYGRLSQMHVLDEEQLNV